jgi:hypothetical protein
MDLETRYLGKRTTSMNSILATKLLSPFCLRTLCALSALCGSIACAAECSAAEIRAWAFEATIIANEDPLLKAADVRVGDTVRGTFSYDLFTEPEPADPDDFAEYNALPGFRGLQVAIENPRTETQIKYVPFISESSEYWVEVWSYDDANDADDEHGIGFYQFTSRPDPDWPNSDFVVINFSHPGLSTDLSLPLSYNLDDWDFTFVYLWVDWVIEGVTAQIHTLAPVMPGDFNLDGDVDLQDYNAWRSDYGVSGYSDADANRDSSIDAADYVAWRNNLGAADIANSATSAPEPTSAMLGMLTIACLIFRRVPQSGIIHCPWR